MTRRVATLKACAVWPWDIRLASRVRATRRLRLARMLGSSRRAPTRWRLAPTRGRILRVPVRLRLATLRDVVLRDHSRWRLDYRRRGRLREPILLPLEPRRVSPARTMRLLPWAFWRVPAPRRSDLLPLDRVLVNCRKPLGRWQWVLPLVWHRRAAAPLPSATRRATPTSKHRQSLWVSWLDLPFREATRLRLERLLLLQTRERRPFRLDCKVGSLDRERAQLP